MHNLTLLVLVLIPLVGSMAVFALPESSPGSAKLAKQISLGSCPLQSSAAEVLAFRYWV